MTEQTKLSRKTNLSIMLLAFAGQLAWAVENQYFNLFIYNEIAPVPSYISLMVAITAVVSTLTAIFMGAYSDRIGKRRVFMIIGYVFWAITTAIFPLSGVFQPVVLAITIAIIFDSIMTFFGAMANDAALNAYVTDITTLENRGKIGSILEIMFLVAYLIIYGLSGYIIESVGYYTFFYIVGGLVAIFGIPGALLAPKPENLKPAEARYWEIIKSSFNKAQIKDNKNYFLILIGVGIWATAFNIFFPFVLIYLEHSLKLSLDVASLLIFVAFLFSIIGAFPIGKIVDKVGRKKLALLAILLESISLILFAFSEDLIFITITASIWLFAIVMWNISSKTWLKDLYPEDKRGQFSGYYILFSVLIGMSIGPLIGGLLSETFGESIVINGQPGFIPPPLIFIVSAFLMLFVFIPIILAKEVKKENNKQNNK